MDTTEEILEIEGLEIAVKRKAILHAYLRVSSPDGQVSVSVPQHIPTERIKVLVQKKLPWIRRQQAKYKVQYPQKAPDLASGESHYLWGQKYLLAVQVGRRTGVTLQTDRILLTIRPETRNAGRKRILYAWYRDLFLTELVPLIRKWEAALGVSVNTFSVRSLKSKWGSCSTCKRHVLFNLELVKRSKDLLEYIVVHELCHLIVPNHSKAFYALLDRYYAGWKEARRRLKCNS